MLKIWYQKDLKDFSYSEILNLFIKKPYQLTIRNFISDWFKVRNVSFMIYLYHEVEYIVKVK